MFQRSVSPAAVILLAGSSQCVAFQTDVAACADVRTSGKTITIPVIAIAEVVPVIIVTIAVSILAVLITMIVAVLRGIRCRGYGLSGGRRRSPAKKT